MSYITCNLVEINCPKCGVPFAVTEGFFVGRQESQRYFWCPNGHAQRAIPPKKPGPTDAEKAMRDENLRLMHRLEQAEARATEVGGKLPPTELPPTDDAGTPAADVPEIASTTTDGGESVWECPHCQRRYWRPDHFRNHLRSKHGMADVAIVRDGQRIA